MIVYHKRINVEIKGNIINVCEGGKYVPESEWELMGTFHKSYLKEIIAGLKVIAKKGGVK